MAVPSVVSAADTSRQFFGAGSLTTATATDTNQNAISFFRVRRQPVP
jgi:hypothetical protein